MFDFETDTFAKSISDPDPFLPDLSFPEFSNPFLLLSIFLSRPFSRVATMVCGGGRARRVGAVKKTEKIRAKLEHGEIGRERSVGRFLKRIPLI